MTKTPGAGDNSNRALLSFVERIERMDEEVKGLQDDRKEIYSEAKGSGYDAAVIRKAIAARRDYEAYKENKALLETYLDALDAAELAERKKSVEDGE